MPRRKSTRITNPAASTVRTRPVGDFASTPESPARITPKQVPTARQILSGKHVRITNPRAL